MEINPLGVLLAIVLIYLVFWGISWFIVELLYRFQIIKIKDRISRLGLAFLLGIVLMVSAYYIKQGSKKDEEPIQVKSLY